MKYIFYSVLALCITAIVITFMILGEAEILAKIIISILLFAIAVYFFRGIL